MTTWEAFAKRFNYDLGQRLPCKLGKGSREPIRVRIFDIEWHRFLVLDTVFA